MSQQYDNTNRFVIFKNDRNDTDTSPDYTGSLNVDGVDYWLDGWIKDGDYNSTFSRTVQPLPHHGQQEYVTPPGKLEDEFVYRRFPQDWQTYLVVIFAMTQEVDLC